MNEDVTAEVKKILDDGGEAKSIGYLCIQGRICSGCTSWCDQSVVLIFPREQESSDGP